MRYCEAASVLWARRRRHRSEQYFTSSQQSSHFLRQLNGRWHTGHTLVGRSNLERERPIVIVKWTVVVNWTVVMKWTVDLDEHSRALLKFYGA